MSISGKRLWAVFFLIYFLATNHVFSQAHKQPVVSHQTPAHDVLTEKSANSVEALNLKTIPSARVDTTKNLTTIAFGSCNKINLPQTMWEAVAANKPDLWIWLGDIIYADTNNMTALSNMYKLLKNNTEYKKLTVHTPVIGVYDDHDYGYNDSGKGYPMKKQSLKIFRDFMSIPPNAPIRKREGAYQSYQFGTGDELVKIIVLDTRYFKDTLLPDPSKKSRYLPNTEGDLLGEAQWKWLERELRSSTAHLNILCSSIQVLSDEHTNEKWGNFPNCRKRLLNLIVNIKPQNLLILSGDRHMIEVSKMDLAGLPYPLYDFTSSGMTHTRKGDHEANKFRVGEMIVKKNFGVLKIRWEAGKPVVALQARGHGNELFQEIIARY